MFIIPLGGGGYLEMMQNASFVLFPIFLRYISVQKRQESIFSYTIPKGLIIIIAIASILCTAYTFWRNNEPMSYISYGKLK
jgi:hypothetical protein